MTYGSILRWDASFGPCPSIRPYGLTWLQRECGKILVKMWYVVAALAETLLEPSDVLFFTSEGYDTPRHGGFRYNGVVTF